MTSGSHRTASLQRGIDSVTSYYMRNKPTESFEQSIAFKASSIPAAGQCDCCHVKDVVADLSVLYSILTSRNLNSFIGSNGVQQHFPADFQGSYFLSNTTSAEMRSSLRSITQTI